MHYGTSCPIQLQHLGTSCVKCIQTWNHPCPSGSLQSIKPSSRTTCPSHLVEGAGSKSSTPRFKQKWVSCFLQRSFLSCSRSEGGHAKSLELPTHAVKTYPSWQGMSPSSSRQWRRRPRRPRGISRYEPSTAKKQGKNMMAQSTSVRWTANEEAFDYLNVTCDLSVCSVFLFWFEVYGCIAVRILKPLFFV